MAQESLGENLVEHPRIKEGSLESRTYQEVIAAGAAEKNTLAVLPTGLGKTAIGILLAAHRLEEYPGSKILMLAPTRPLVEQHREEFRRCLHVETGIYEVLTGETRPEKRAEKWREVGCFFATPQVVENDIINGRVSLEDFSLILFDEVHRASGEYPYSFIAERYVEEGSETRILGLTASPGSEREKIEKVAEDLYIENFEIRTEEDPEVSPYVKKKNVRWVEVELDRNFLRVKRHLEEAKRERLKKLKRSGLLDSISGVKRRDLLRLKGKIGSRLKEEDDPKLYQGISLVAGCMKVEHCLELLETQGIGPLYRFFEGMEKDRDTKATRSLLNDEEFRNAISVAEWMYNNGKEHPKLEKLKGVLEENIEEGKNAMVFTQFRDTVDLLVEKLGEAEGLEPRAFKGQKEGFTQKKQLEILEDFRSGEFNLLVSTSVGEEGLDIPAVDYVMFYEPIPSEIRTIQRRGRTGRQEAGDIYIFMAKNTRDEAYYWSAKNKEKRMKETMKELDDREDANDGKGGQVSLDGFSEEGGVTIFSDDRENRIMKELTRRDVKVRSKRLEIGDFIVSDRTVVERKRTDDFVSSILDNRLFNQMNELVGQFENVVLIIEGDTIFGHRDVHPNALRGALSSIVLDYGVPILWSSGEEETSDLLVALARREQEEQDRGISIRGEKSPLTEDEMQKFIVSGLPSISDRLAERLLEEFGSVRDVFQASEEEMKRVEGIGEGKAKRIKEIIDRGYRGD